MLNSRGSIWMGVVTGLVLSVGGVILLLFWSSTFKTPRGQWTYENPATGALLLIGAAQAVWMAPASLALYFTQRVQMLKGVLLVAGAIFLLNAALLLSLYMDARRRFAR